VVAAVVSVLEALLVLLPVLLTWVPESEPQLELESGVGEG
jgi:hypothetical protein